MPLSPHVEVPIPKSLPEGEKDAKKRKAKRATKKSKQKDRHNGPNNSNDEIGENPFHNHEVVRDLVDGFTILKVVDRIIDADIDQHT
ncbi:putative ensconsin-like [Cocos nucifera]|nr:putative ensconsin-like [Cocos nucifera]